MESSIKVSSNAVILLEGERKVRLWECEIVVTIVAIGPAASNCLCLCLSGNNGFKVK
jgi:hypothetical protein